MLDKAPPKIPQRIPPQLGIRFDNRVRGYLFGLLALGMQAPEEAFNRIRSIAEIVLYAVPSPRFTQERFEELLRRVEIVMRAMRIILDRSGREFFERVLDATTDPFLNQIPADRSPTQTEVKAAMEEATQRLEQILNEVTSNRDSSLRTALRVLQSLERVLDLERPIPRSIRVSQLGISPIPPRGVTPPKTGSRRTRKTG